MSDARDASVVEHLQLNSAESGVIDVGSAHAVVSAGGLLRQAREASGLHIAALAVSLKVPVKKLEALEADRFELLPDAVFIRALASSVCRNLKIDPAPVLERLPESGSPKLAYRGMSINTPFRAPGDRPGPSAWAQVSRPAVVAVLLLLLGALVLILLPAVKTGVNATGFELASRAINTQTPVLGSIEGAAETVSAANLALGSSASSVTVSSFDMSSPVSVAGSPSMAFPSSPLPARAALQTLVAPASPANAFSAVSATGIVVFSAKGPSWVEVTDSKGVVVLRRTLAAGEVVGASGALPLTAVVGRADVTQVQIRGKALDLTAVAKDNVARFEVK